MKSNKRPLLLREVRAHWEDSQAAGTVSSIRDGFAVVFAFFFACRVSELMKVTTEDIQEVVLVERRPALRVYFRSVKNRQTIFTTHEPFAVTCAHSLLLTAFSRFRSEFGLVAGAVVFRRSPGEIGPMSREWFAAVVRRAAAGATPHSCRVGMATELWAAGARISDILSVGRWTSAAALLYVLQPVQEQVDAVDRLGDGGLVYTPEGIQHTWSVQGASDGLPVGKPDKWREFIGPRTEEEEVVDEWE